jgi:hypothetical protein
LRGRFCFNASHPNSGLPAFGNFNGQVGQARLAAGHFGMSHQRFLDR